MEIIESNSFSIHLFWFADIFAEKPKYEIGSASKLSFAKKETESKVTASVWKLTDDEDDLINADDLLDEKDKEKPNPLDLRGMHLNCSLVHYPIAKILTNSKIQKKSPSNNWNKMANYWLSKIQNIAKMDKCSQLSL